MKRTFPFTLGLLWTASVFAADSSPKETLLSAAKALADKPNYSWKTTVEVPGDPTGTIGGKTEKSGATVLVLARGDRSFEAVIKGNKAAVKDEEGWKSSTEAAADSSQNNATRFVARLVTSFKAPAAEVMDLAGKVNELKLTDGAYAGILSEAATKELLLYRTAAGADGVEVNGAKGSIQFWTKDGTLTKYEFKVKGTISFNGRDREVDRTHTTELKAVGSTKVEVPEEAAKKL